MRERSQVVRRNGVKRPSPGDDVGRVQAGVDNGTIRHGRPAGRVLECLVGVVCAVLGAALAALAMFGVVVALVREGPPAPPSVLLLTLVIGALAGLLLVFAWRLLWNRARRSDGGLLSPFGLRVGGLIFLASPVAAVVGKPVGLLHVLGALAASGACFALARHRERHPAQRDSSASV